MIASNRYRQAESLLYGYPVNLSALEEAYEEYSRVESENDLSMRPDSMSTARFEGNVADMVAGYVNFKLMLEERIKALQGKVWPVQRMIDVLKARRRIKGYKTEELGTVFSEHYCRGDKCLRMTELEEKKSVLVGLCLREMH